MSVIKECTNIYGGGYRIHDDYIKGKKETEEMMQRVSQIITKSMIRQQMEKKQGEEEVQILIAQQNQ